MIRATMRSRDGLIERWNDRVMLDMLCLTSLSIDLLKVVDFVTDGLTDLLINGRCDSLIGMRVPI